MAAWVTYASFYSSGCVYAGLEGRLSSDVLNHVVSFLDVACVFPVKAVAPGSRDERCVCTCADCSGCTGSSVWCECKSERRRFWADFKYDVLERLSCAPGAKQSERYSYVSLYAHRMNVAVNEAVFSLQNTRKTYDGEANIVKATSYYVPSPSNGYLSYFRELNKFIVWRGEKWYSKLLSKLAPLYASACAQIDAAVQQHNEAALKEACSAESAAKRARVVQAV